MLALGVIQISQLIDIVLLVLATCEWYVPEGRGRAPKYGHVTSHPFARV